MNSDEIVGMDLSRVTRPLSLSCESNLLCQFLDRLEVLLDASVKKVVVIGASDHKESLFFRRTRVKERLTFDEWNQMVFFAVDDQAGLAKGADFFNIPEGVLLADAPLFHGETEELQQRFRKSKPAFDD